MNLKLSDKTRCESSYTEAGFSLIETVIALTTLGVCLAYAMPLFLYAKVNNSKSEIRTGALIVSQRVFDKIRSKSIASLPSNDGVASVSSVNPESLPVETAMGRSYQTTVTYCEGVNANSTVCSDKYRKFKVEVSYNGTKVYDLEGTYTQFE